jgi:hypothetical protein
MHRCLHLCVAFFFSLTAHAALTVTIGQRSVTAQGLTPGAGAVFFSVGHEPHLAYFKFRRLARFVADDDRDGMVTCALDYDVPRNSVWFVADPAAHTYVQATPEQFPRVITAEARSLPRKDANGDWSALLHERQWLELLLIAKEGVYELTAMRGGAADVEKKNGTHFATPIELFRAVTPGSKSLKHLGKGDLVIAIDPHQLDAFVVEIE